MSSYFETTDLNTSALIISVLGKEPEYLDRSEPDRIKFVFKRIEGLDELLESYWRKELKIEPISFATAQKFLKQQIYNR